VEGIGLAPTDVLHAAGLYTAGDRNAAELGVRIYAIALQMDEGGLIKKVMDKVSSRIAEEVLNKVFTDELGQLPSASALPVDASRPVRAREGIHMPGTQVLREGGPG